MRVPGFGGSLGVGVGSQLSFAMHSSLPGLHSPLRKPLWQAAGKWPRKRAGNVSIQFRITNRTLFPGKLSDEVKSIGLDSSRMACVV
jgi:hypothetical protein